MVKRRRRKPQYAGFWLRFVAHIIDSILIGIVSIIIGVIVGVGVAIGSMTPFTNVTSSVITIIIAWLYYAGLESSDRQATFGKQAMNLKVTDLRGRQITFIKATGRHFAKILSGLILFIGYIMIGFTEKKQGLHDILAGCLVVKR
jgi:uncharacterized RDD family membrane protein YckC